MPQASRMLSPLTLKVSLLLCASLGFLISGAGATAVNVGLEASFDAPSYLLELLETAAQENASSYFPLLDRIADGYFLESTTEEELYNVFLRLLKEDGHFTNPEAFATFKLALSLRAAAPRIQAHYQFYNTSIDSVLTKAQDASCPVWVHFNGKQYCSPALDRAQQDFDGPNGDDLPFDRSIQAEEEGTPVSTLYGDITSPLFGHFHQVLSATAKKGQTAYRVRYRPPMHGESRPLRVGGYGVELQLKRTDYIVIDDREDSQKSTGADQKLSGDKDVEDMSDLKPLSSSELLGLGLKTSGHILSSESPLDVLLRVSQDFPKYSSTIAQLNISSDFVSEHEANRDILLPEGYNVLWMNGLQIPWREMDAFSLLERLRKERTFVHGLQACGLTAPEAISLISHGAITDSRTTDDVVRYDWRDQAEGGKVIVWLNNIEKDKRYADWTAEASGLLQRMFPGQLPSVRRDIHNLVMPVDLGQEEGVDTIVNVLYPLVQRQIPVRFGFVPGGSSQVAERHARIVYHLRETYGIGAALAYLQQVHETKKPGNALEKLFTAAAKDRKLRPNQESLKFKEVIEGENTQPLLENSRAYLKRLGAAGKNPPAFINGVPVTQNEQWLQAMSGRVSTDLQTIQHKVYMEGISDDVWLAGEFLTTASANRNSLIVPEDENDVDLVELVTIFAEHGQDIGSLPTSEADKSTNASHWNHVFVIADEDAPQGASLIEAATAFRSGESASGVELQTIKNPVESGSYAKLVASLGFKPGDTGIVVNGRRIGPISIEESFSSQDFDVLLHYERTRKAGPVVEALANLTIANKLKTPKDLATVSSLVALSGIQDVPQGIYESTGGVRMDAFNTWSEEHSAFRLGNNKTATVQIIGSIDPTSELAQRWAPMIKALSQLDGVFVKLFFNPRGRLQELPIKRFYRYVLDPEPKFSADGSLLEAGASFEGIPREALLNMGLDVPPAWLVSAKDSIYDLDNLKLSAVRSGDVNAVYELESILIEGHSKDVTASTAPRGAQLILGTESDPATADTLIMANLGYFQFKANPGYWKIQLKGGRSDEIFQIDTIGTDGDQSKASDSHVALMSWQGKTLFPRFSRKAGKEEEDVLADPGAVSSGDFFAKAKSFGQSILSKANAVTKRKHADINIFSVASGHLYERMLNIMMVSVMKNTKHTVKFWFIEQFLSPSFKASIHHLAEAYGFEYELVTYKWPHWLRSQKEKQREIWGYKILFLDVLFPLDLDKVIFVDSDQIVRTDMYDLVTHDLEGAPYGFTPMCDSRTEMEGFRFWKQGYWKNFLRGLPYHISALYVVDLKRFRAMAAGDRLRGQYHQLSADPNSLSNLDQDLPNNMQMQLPIHSLPQEWLWCETWCSDESLKDARTIDLCNNPLTKEPKLDRARRQVPEWTVYDDEIAETFRQAMAKEGQEVKAPDSASIQEEMDRQAKKEFDEKKSREKDEL